MKKTYFIADIVKKIGEKVELMGWVYTKRDHKKIVFLDLRDKSGIVQVVGDDKFASLTPESAVKIIGTVVERPPHMVNSKIPTGSIEVQADEFEVLSPAPTLPFEINVEKLDLTLPTLLDWRPLTMRNLAQTDIFRVQSAIATGFRNAALALGCLEIFTPTIAGGSSEGGTEVFPIKYYEHDAFLVQSPQLYKQMLIPVFERVSMISKAYRAEPSVTTRHLSESTQMDCELGFFEFAQLLDALEKVGTETIRFAYDQNMHIFAKANIHPPLIPKSVPRLTLKEALDLIFEKTGRDVRNEPDLDPEGERFLCQWSAETHESDFVTVTHFPMSKRPFYTLPDPNNPQLSLSYDLLFRGVEVLSGAQRQHDFQLLKNAIKEKGMDTSNFGLYLQAFEFGMPPHGGFSFGLERLTMKLLELENVREASLFPRDMERIDTRLSQ